MAGIEYPSARRDETHFDDFHGEKVGIDFIYFSEAELLYNSISKSVTISPSYQLLLAQKVNSLDIFLTLKHFSDQL